MIKVLSWNVHVTNQNNQELEQLVEKESPDIVVLIEPNHSLLQKSASILKKYPDQKLLPSNTGSGIAVVSRFPMTDFKSFSLAGFPLQAIEFRFKHPLTGKNWAMLAVHTKSPNLGASQRTRERDAQLIQIGEWANEHASEAILVIGDYNITPWSPPYQKLLRTAMLRDSRWYRGNFPSWPQEAGYFAIPIDHALVNSQVEVLDRQTIYDPLYSDHRPITVTVR